MDNHGLPRKSYCRQGSSHGGSRGSSGMGSRHGSEPALKQSGAGGQQQEVGGVKGGVTETVPRHSSSPAVVEGVVTQLEQ
jgi:hypothetical protein